MKKFKKPMTKTEVDKLTDAQVLILMAREALIKNGLTIEEEPLRVPPEIAAAPREKGARHVYSPKWEGQTHKCPHCKKTKDIVTEIGLRLVRGVERKQSYCRACRSSINYHALPRMVKNSD